MAISKVSAKYQVVIPKELRKLVSIKPGQKVTVDVNKAGDITIDTKLVVDEYYGVLKSPKNNDPIEELRKMRDEWEEHQTQLDRLWDEK